MIEFISVTASMMTLISAGIQGYAWYRRLMKKQRRERLAKQQEAKHASDLAASGFPVKEKSEATSVPKLSGVSRMLEEWQDYKNQDLQEMQKNGSPQWKIKLYQLGWDFGLLQANLLVKLADLLVKDTEIRK